MKNEETKEKKQATKRKTSTSKTTAKESQKQASKKSSKIKEETLEQKGINTKEKKLVEEEKKEMISKKEIKKQRKNSDILLILGLIVVVFLGFVVTKGEKEEPSYTLPLTLTGEAGLRELSYAEYQEKVDNNESFVLIIERATCSHCVNFMPVAESFANDNNVPMYYVDTDTFTEEDWEGFEKSNTFLKKKNGNWGTPTTVVLAGKEAVDYIEGETPADNLKELYNQYFDMNQE